MLVALVLVPWCAWAQEPPVVPLPAEAAPPPLPSVPALVVGTQVWTRAGDTGGRQPLDNLAANPRAPGTLLVIDTAGAVFHSDDAGSTWTLVLPASEAEEVDDEAVLLDATERVFDELEDAEGAEADDEGEATSSATGVTEGVREELDELAGAEAVRLAPCAVWFDPAVPDVALAARHDGIWRSPDGGLSWYEVDDAVGASEIVRWGEVIVLGGTTGIRVTADGGWSFLDLEGATHGATVYQLAPVGEALYAATSGGLFRSTDGLRWSWVPAAGTGSIRTVVPDPAWPGGFWLAGDEGLRRSDDGGATVYSAGVQPMRGLRRILALPQPGQLLAVGGDGVWESMDGGVRWVWAGRLLTEPDVRSVAMLDGRPVLATASGLWRLTEAVTLPDQAPPPARGLSRAEAVEVALDRSGLTLLPLSLAGRAALASFTPSLLVTLERNGDARRTAYELLRRTTEYSQGAWQLQVAFCWGGCDAIEVGPTDSDYYDDGTFDADAYAEDAYERAQESAEVEDSLYVLDGDVYDEGQVVLAAANVAERSTEYRWSVAAAVGEAWDARQRLAAEAPLYADRPLSDQVARALKLEELDARLDAYTQGAWSSSLLPEVPR